jgi:hypothetical protein
MVFWPQPGRLITLSCSLIKDGIPPSNSALGMGIMDPENDPMARMFR